MIPYGRQTIDDEDVTAVVSALRSDLLTTGPEVERFEAEFAAMVGAKHAVAVCNATAALHLAMLVAEVGPGDRVVTSPNTFLSSANCAPFVGATPDFADIDPVTHNLSPAALRAGWQDDTKAVIAVAYGGWPADMPAIAKVARERGAVVIEDGCHGPGGGFFHEGEFYKIGGHPWADITTFSFHPVKTITTGEGGILVTDNAHFAARARLLRSHGMVRDPGRFEAFGQADREAEGEAASLFDVGPWVYEMQDLGFNYRITDLQCALGRSQLAKLPRFMARRQRIVEAYNQAFARLDWLTTPPDLGWREDVTHRSGEAVPIISRHLYTVEIDFKALGMSRRAAIAALRENGVGSQVLYIPVYLQPWYQRRYGYRPGKCPVAEGFYARCLSLPLFPGMSDAEVGVVIAAVENLERAASA